MENRWEKRIAHFPEKCHNCRTKINKGEFYAQRSYGARYHPECIAKNLTPEAGAAFLLKFESLRVKIA